MKKIALALALAAAIPTASAQEGQTNVEWTETSANIFCRALVSDIVEVAQNRLNGVPVWETIEQYSFLDNVEEKVMTIYTMPREMAEDTGKMYGEFYSHCMSVRGHAL